MLDKSIHYNISDLEMLSGIKSHTIRKWEQRYHLLKPHRTRTNIRFYTNEDLRKILNVNLLLQHGKKISKLSTYSLEQLHDEVIRVSENNDTAAEHFSKSSINSLMVAALGYDEEKFEKAWVKMVRRLGVVQSMTQVIYPLLTRV